MDSSIPGLYISIYSPIFIAEQFWKFGYFRKSFDNPKLFRNFLEFFLEPFRNFLRIFLKFFWNGWKNFEQKAYLQFFSALRACLVSLPIFQSAHLLIIRLSGITFRIKNNGPIKDILSNDSSKCYVKKETWISQIANKESHKSSSDFPSLFGLPMYSNNSFCG